MRLLSLVAWSNVWLTGVGRSEAVVPSYLNDLTSIYKVFIHSSVIAV